MIKTCNMLLMATSVYTFFPTISFLLHNFSFNSALSRNHGVFKQHMNLTGSAYNKMHCLALFLQRQYKIKLWACWLQENLSTMYTKISYLFNEWLLLSIRSYEWGVFGLSLLVCAPHDGDPLTQIEAYNCPTISFH